LVGDGVPTEGLGAALLPLASSSSAGCTTGIIYTKKYTSNCEASLALDLQHIEK